MNVDIYMNEENLSFANDALLKYTHDDSEGVFSVSGLDGFLTSIISGPSMIMPSQWMPQIWGGDAYAPEWESEQELTRFTGFVFALMNSNVNCLMEKPDEFRALFLEKNIKDKTYLVVDDWCDGFMKGVMLDTESWFSAPEIIHNALACISVFVDKEHYDMLNQLSEKGFKNLQAKIEPSVRAIHAYFLKQRAAEILTHTSNSETSVPAIRSAPKLGRNDPCSCGSGKKYKKCCLMPLMLVK